MFNLEESIKILIDKVNNIDKRLDNIETRIENIEERLDNLEKRFDNLEKRFDDLEKRFDDLEKRFDDLEKKFDIMSNRQDHFEVILTEFIYRTEDEFEKINKVLNQYTIDIATIKDALVNQNEKYDSLNTKYTNLTYRVNKMVLKDKDR